MSKSGLRVLRDYALDSLDGDAELQSIATFAAKLCEAPLGAVSLVEEERQRFLASEGLETKETPRGISFCTHAMLRDDLMQILDATQEPQFADNPLVHRRAAHPVLPPASRSSPRKACRSARCA
jgi:hypothetical protein